jgi:hypothetical protein
MMKRYFFNREERFFCAFVMCALQNNPAKISDMLQLKRLITGNVEIYIESSVIRDHWMNMGKPNQKSEQAKNELNMARENYLKALCRKLGFNFDDIREREHFKSANRYIQSPGNWKDLAKDDVVGFQLRAIFNMRQDIMIIENNNLHFIEAKLDSANSREQVENMLLLKKLHDQDARQWACIDAFGTFDSVNLYYIKRTEKPFRIENESVNDDIKRITWDHVFDTLQMEKAYANFGIADHRDFLFSPKQRFKD